MIVADNYHSLVLDVWSLFYMSCIPFSVKVIFCYPTMHGMDDVMFLFDMYNQLVYPHLVGWMSQSWYTPTWLGDGCMYKSLMIERSCVMYRVL